MADTELLLPATTIEASPTSPYRSGLYLLFGFIIGIYSTAVWLNSQSQCNTLAIHPITTKKAPTESSIRNNTADSTVINESLNHTPASTADIDVDLDPSTDIVEYLYNNTRVLCWIMTNPANHLTKAIHIRHTWGRRCNKLLFISSEEDEELGTIALPVKEGREHLWDKTNLALKYIYDHHLDDADWFLKADDDTYVIMENLRQFLYQYPMEVPLYFGCKFDNYVRQGYMSGGSGYVLSKKALMKFSTEAFNNKEKCSLKILAEDVQLGMCLEKIGVIAGDSRDAEDNERFVPLAPYDVIPNAYLDWYLGNVHHEPDKNVTCCSDSAISFHYITPDDFYVFEYLLYVLRPFGVIGNLTENLPRKDNISNIYAAAVESPHPLLAPPTVRDVITGKEEILYTTTF